MFNPRANYWLAEDGRVFFGGSESIIKSDDGGFVEWGRGGNRPTPWPRDAAGEQTEAALQSVFEPYGMFASLAAYAADARWRAEIAGVEIGGMRIATDDRSKMMIMGARMAAQNPTWTTIWRDMSGAGHEITAAQMIGISDAVQAHVNSTFVTLAIVLGEIADGHITDRAGVDAAFSAPGTFAEGVAATHENAAAAEQQAVEKEKEAPPADAPAQEAAG